MTETYTFSRALYMMRYGGKKMKPINNRDDRFYFVKDDMLMTKSHYWSSPFSVSSNDIMGSWVEVKDDSKAT